MSERGGNKQSFMNLKRFLESQPKLRAGGRCEFCSAEIPEDHSHVVNIEMRSLMCVCRACYLLFTHEGAARGRYKAVPQRYLYAPGLVLTDAQWDKFQIPVGIAFFFFNTALGRMAAFYPSPAGATESLLSLETWNEVVQSNPLLESLAPDVEALLIQTIKKRGGFECYVVPIDTCYELVGRIRRHWRGFDGGEAVWKEIDAFFAGLRVRSEAVEAQARRAG